MRAVVHSRIMAKEQEVVSAERLAAEGGIVSDERAVAEPEIEASEGAAVEHENEPVESAAAEGDSSEAGCPIRMGDFKDPDAPRCGRKLHEAPDGVDNTPVCLMHSQDPYKQSWPVSDDFWEEFERTLEAAGENEAHFDFRWSVTLPRVRSRQVLRRSHLLRCGCHPRIKFYARRAQDRRGCFSAQRGDHHRSIAVGARRNPSQTVHQPLEQTLRLQ